VYIVHGISEPRDTTTKKLLEGFHSSKNWYTKSPGERNEVSRCSFQFLLFQNYVMCFLCRVASIFLMLRAGEGVSTAQPQTPQDKPPFRTTICKQQHLMQGSVLNA
jgi:hypothetical protein